VKYHSARRGYIGCTVTPAQFRADFKVLDSVTTPNLPAKTGASLIVEAGRPGTETL
jgi:alkaline phosphatase D